MYIKNMAAAADADNYGQMHLVWEYGDQRDEVVEIRFKFFREQTFQVHGDLQVLEEEIVSKGNVTTGLLVSNLHPFGSYTINVQVLNNKGQPINVDTIKGETKWNIVGDYVRVVDHIENNGTIYTGHGVQPNFGIGECFATNEFTRYFLGTAPQYVQLRKYELEPEFAIKFRAPSIFMLDMVSMERFLAGRRFVSIDVESGDMHEYPVIADFRVNVANDELLIPVDHNPEDRIFSDDFGYEWIGGIS